jgi:hypothetical protein
VYGCVVFHVTGDSSSSDRPTFRRGKSVHAQKQHRARDMGLTAVPCRRSTHWGPRLVRERSILCLISLSLSRPIPHARSFSPILPDRPCLLGEMATGIGNGVRFLAFIIARSEWDQTGLSLAAERRPRQDRARRTISSGSHSIELFQLNKQWQEVVSVTRVCALNFSG